MPAGRPTKLTPQVIEAVRNAILAGNYRNVAARAAGVPVRTFQLWLANGRTHPDGLYGQLLHAVQKAEGDAETLMVARIAMASQDDWKAALAWLERKHPQRWSRYRGELVELQKRLAELEKRLANETADEAT